MGLSEEFSTTFNRVKSDVKELLFGQLRSVKTVGHMQLKSSHRENVKSRPKQISKKHMSDHPLFNSSSPRCSPSYSPHSKASVSSSDPRKFSDPRGLNKPPLQQRVAAKRTTSVPLQQRERVTRTISLPSGLTPLHNGFCPVHQYQDPDMIRRSGRLEILERINRPLPEVDRSSVISDCSSEHIYEEIHEDSDREDFESGKSFLLSISNERRNNLRKYGRATWDMEESPHSYS